MPATDFGRLLAGRPNNFDAIRLALAAAVIASHAKIGAAAAAAAAEPAGAWHGVQFLGLGRMAVNGFFALSGFLIARSWVEGRGLGDFARKRALRIYPGWVVCMALTLFVVAPLGGGVLPRLLRDPATVRFFGPLALGPETQLPGVFLDSPHRGQVLGPVWSIRFELGCYALTALLGLAGVLRRPRAVAALAGASIALFTAQVVCFPTVRLALPYLGEVDEVFRLTSFFLVGSAFYTYRDRIPHSARLFALALALVSLAATYRVLPTVAVPLLGAYALFYVAFLRIPVVGGKFRNDFSYGLYLYSFPVMQLVLGLCGPRLASRGRLLGSAALFGSTLLATSVPAALSWWAVEKPFLRRKAPGGRRPAAAPIGVTPEGVSPLAAG